MIKSLPIIRFGRKPAALTTSFVLFVAMTLTAATNSYPTFLALSILAGVCVGGSLSIAFTYWAEVSNESHRLVTGNLSLAVSFTNIRLPVVWPERTRVLESDFKCMNSSDSLVSYAHLSANLGRSIRCVSLDSFFTVESESE